MRTVTNVFQSAKRAPIIDLAFSLGIKGRVTSKGRAMVHCPFHEDKTPSMCLYEKPTGSDYYCFSCQTHGDAADLMARVRHMKNREAAIAVCEQYHLPYDLSDNGKKPEEAPPYEAQVIREACVQWRKHRIRGYLDKQERWEGEVDRLAQAGMTQCEAFTVALEQAARARGEADRWSSMSFAGVLMEIQEEMSRYTLMTSRAVPVLGVVR